MTTPPPVFDGDVSDYITGGVGKCDSSFEICMTMKAAKHTLDLQNWIQETWERCKAK